jgi:parvulin-like peptidyl-prolyl isomerase
LLAQKLAAQLDTPTQARAASAHTQLVGGADFAALAGQLSDDAATKGNGGQYTNTAITSASTDVPPAVVRALASLSIGQTSDVIQAGSTLEIVKLLANDNGKFKAAHISFNLKDAATYLAPLKKAHPTHTFIKVQ